MSDMMFREPNRVKWIGTHPAHDGVQISDSGFQGGAGNNSFYTVTAGKTLFLTFASLDSRESANAAGSAALVIYTAIPALWRYILHHLYHLAGHQVSVTSFTFPLEIPAGYTIETEVSHANISAFGLFWGWEE